MREPSYISLSFDDGPLGEKKLLLLLLHHLLLLLFALPLLLLLLVQLPPSVQSECSSGRIMFFSSRLLR
jgi:hypothetical protein